MEKAAIEAEPETAHSFKVPLHKFSVVFLAFLIGVGALLDSGSSENVELVSDHTSLSGGSHKRRHGENFTEFHFNFLFIYYYMTI